MSIEGKKTKTKEKEPLIVSACLMGIGCRYDGESRGREDLSRLAEKYTLIPVCPEIYGGLPTPRTPAEIVGARVLTRDGRDVTAEYERGAAAALKIAEITGAKKALLKERSPSCGTGSVYDGTFTGALRPGDGVAAALLRRAGLSLFGESDIPELLGGD